MKRDLSALLLHRQIINDMPNVKYQNAAMEYVMWYQEQLLQMEGILGKKIEANIEKIIDRKFNEYIEEKKK